MKKIISILLGLTLIISGSVFAFANDEIEQNANDIMSISSQKTSVSKKPILTVYQSTDLNAAYLSWTKSKASVYVIYRADNGQSDYKVIKTTKKLNYLDKKLKSGETYDYKVIGYKKVKGKYKYTKFSNKDSITIASAAANEYIFTLDSNITTGYSWDYVIDDKSIADITENYYIDGTYGRNICGASGVDVFRVKAIKAGTVTITLKYTSPDGNVSEADTKVIKLNVDKDLKIIKIS